MGAQAPAGLLGIHSNMPGTAPPEVAEALVSGAPAPSGLSAEESAAFERLRFLYTKGIGYATEPIAVPAPATGWGPRGRMRSWSARGTLKTHGRSWTDRDDLEPGEQWSWRLKELAAHAQQTD
jgi:hypothetical protein